MAPSKTTPKVKPASPRPLPTDRIQRVNVNLSVKLIEELQELYADDPTKTTTDIIRSGLRLLKRAREAHRNNERLYRSASRNLISQDNLPVTELDVD